MRHGQAHPQVTDDASRTLTKQGVSETQLVSAKAFIDKKIKPTHIISSIYTRAIQTANTVAKALDYKANIPTTDHILPDSNPREALEFLAKQTVDSLLIVSHQPLVGQLISLLVDGVIEERHIPTSAIAYIKIDTPIMMGSGHLKWMETP